jgi:hypothetical protein
MRRAFTGGNAFHDLVAGFLARELAGNFLVAHFQGKIGVLHFPEHRVGDRLARQRQASLAREDVALGAEGNRAGEDGGEKDE